MLKQTISYKGFDGKEYVEDFYFNYTKTELLELELSGGGSFAAFLDRILKENDHRAIAAAVKDLILGAYGVRSEDGKRFIKTPELRDAFAQTEAFSNLYWDLLFDGDKQTAFIKAVFPPNLDEIVAELKARAGETEDSNQTVLNFPT